MTTTDYWDDHNQKPNKLYMNNNYLKRNENLKNKNAIISL